MNVTFDNQEKRRSASGGWLILGTLYGALVGRAVGTFDAARNFLDLDRHLFVMWSALLGILTGLFIGLFADCVCHSAKRQRQLWLALMILLAVYVLAMPSTQPSRMLH